MICQGCGEKMRLVRETTEGAKTFLWYACEAPACGQEFLHIKAEKPAPGRPPAGPRRRPSSSPDLFLSITSLSLIYS
jgi:hypothetical protein